MKKKSTFFFLLAALTLAACKYDDSELWEQVNQNTEELAAQAARIAALEAWQAETNTNIQALQTLLSTTDYITAVTPVVKDGVEVGFTISFLNTPAITIYHGTKGDKGDKGDTPQIGAAQGDDGNWYWTLNGELLTDADGNHIQANGAQGEPGSDGSDGNDAPMPQLATGTKLSDQGIITDSQGNAIMADAIYLSVDSGKTWTRVSGKDGDKFFQSVVTTNDDYVTFTLADGSTFQVPRYTGISLTFDPASLSIGNGKTEKIQCTAEGSEYFTPDNLFVVAPSGWKTDIALTRSASTVFTLTVTAPDTDSTGEILVMLDNKKGNTTIGRIPVFCGTKLTIGNHQPGQLAALIGSRTDLTSITVTSGTLNDDDWNAITQNEWTLQTLDLAGATYNTNNLKYVKSSYKDPVPLTTAKLPQGVTGLSISAFLKCKKLTSINIPEGVTSIGNLAFYNCSALTSIELPASLTSIGVRVFAFSGIQTLTCRATTPPDAGSDGEAFKETTSISKIRVPAGSVEAYKQTPGWNLYSIVAIPEP